MICDACHVMYVNGIKCHEAGCPEAWRDYDRECFECGHSFRPTDRHQALCEGCTEDYERGAAGDDLDPAGGDDGYDSDMK